MDMTRATSARAPSALALATAATALAAVPTSAMAAQHCRTMSRAVQKENRAAARLVRRLGHNPSYTIREKTFKPRITRTHHFTGFGSIVVRAPRGTAPVVGSFRLRDADRCAIRITGAGVVLRRNAYVIRFKAPGEQGNPGRVTVTLISV